MVCVPPTNTDLRASGPGEFPANARELFRCLPSSHPSFCCFPPPQPPLHSSDVTDMLFADWLWAWGGKSGLVKAWRGKEGGGSHTRT